jgi:hypothetical protein
MPRHGADLRHHADLQTRGTVLNRIAIAAAAASLIALAACDSKPDETSKVLVRVQPVAPGTVAAKGATPAGHETTPEAEAAAAAYAQSQVAKAALDAAGPKIEGLPQNAIAQANELAVCRIAFAVKHGEAARAPSDVEIRSAAFDMATSPGALKECQSRG